MSKTHTRRKGTQKIVRPHLVALAVLSIATSFVVGVHSSDNLETIAPLEAHTTQVLGDMNRDGISDDRDAAVILEILLGYEESTVDQLIADPNQDGILTLQDALTILNHDTF